MGSLAWSLGLRNDAVLQAALWVCSIPSFSIGMGSGTGFRHARVV